MNPYINDELFHFLLDLQENNNRSWFHENKNRFEEKFREPLQHFIQDFQEPLASISPCYTADPRKQGGSLFRIYRDVRFSKNKEPYKTHAGLHFRHIVAKDVHAPGFYLHLSVEECFFGAGIWHPIGEDLKALRSFIQDNAERWQKVKNQSLKARLPLTGDRLKRPPRGFSADDPMIEDLKWKDFILSRELGLDEVRSGDFMKKYTGLCKDSMVLMDFICDALNLEK
ncbi:MAG: TIGR02453 family protein [Spirochaetaceae bacterium]|jgi:uncharacterized protein (TIGR02453 family)|nr:TIGR02453 family protein [Spirochaetaceae bacterium]